MGNNKMLRCPPIQKQIFLTQTIKNIIFSQGWIASSNNKTFAFNATNWNSYLVLRPVFAFVAATVGSATSIFPALSLYNMAGIVVEIFWQQGHN